MTRKRYQKLFRSEMTKLMNGKQGAAQCIKAAANSRPAHPDGTVIPYQQMWTALCSTFTYPGNVPPAR